jgi:hypothetical protein
MINTAYNNGLMAALVRFKLSNSMMHAAARTGLHTGNAPTVMGNEVMWQDEQGGHMAPWSGNYMQPGDKQPWQQTLLRQPSAVNPVDERKQKEHEAVKHMGLDLMSHVMGV